MTSTPRRARGLLAAGPLMALALMLAGTLVTTATPAHAEDSSDQEVRLRKLEAEVRALQRQVFPGGDRKFFPQDATPQTGPAAAPQPGMPATTPITDLLSRMDAIEAQNTRLTSQNEELANRVRILEAARAQALSAEAPPPAPPPAVGYAPSYGPAATPAPAAAPAPRPAARPAPVDGDLGGQRAPAAGPIARPSAQRLAGVQAIIKPQTGDAGEDEYTYGFKLWEAKFYPEAEQQLKLFLDHYPRHRRSSYARNLLGRAYLDEGKPREAAPWFLQNYQGDKKGDRAADSLLYLAETMVKMKDTNRACIALAEFADTYKTEAAGRLQGQYNSTTALAKCN